MNKLDQWLVRNYRPYRIIFVIVAVAATTLLVPALGYMANHYQETFPLWQPLQDFVSNKSFAAKLAATCLLVGAMLLIAFSMNIKNAEKIVVALVVALIGMYALVTVGHLPESALDVFTIVIALSIFMLVAGAILTITASAFSFALSGGIFLLIEAPEMQSMGIFLYIVAVSITVSFIRMTHRNMSPNPPMELDTNSTEPS